MVTAIIDYKNQIKDEKIPVETAGGAPQCMSQYYNILSACRVPGVKKDMNVNYFSDKYEPSRHITVLHNNHVFSVDVCNPEGQVYSIDQLSSQFRKVVEQSQSPCPPIGMMTTENRNVWGKVYSKMIKDKQNKAYFDDVQKSIFVLCLDKAVAHTDPDNRGSSIAMQMNNGQGSQWNTGNRWFDKILQVIVGTDGSIGVNYEHSTAEGPPIISILDHTMKMIENQDFSSQMPTPGLSEPRELKFNLAPQAIEAIDTATDRVDSLISDLEMYAYSFTGFGKGAIKACKVSPDAFIQVGLQLAYYRLHGHSVATYESGSLRKFYHGRTDTIRSCTIESDRYCQAMTSTSATQGEKAKLLKEAIQSHRKYTSWILNGQGIDRHLLGLKLLAVENGMNVPELFMDPVFTTGSSWVLSTSQVPSKCGGMMCYGPAVPDGYGVCYNPMEDSIIFAISAWNSSAETSNKRLAESLHESFMEGRDLLMQSQGAKL